MWSRNLAESGRRSLDGRPRRPRIQVQPAGVEVPGLLPAPRRASASCGLPPPARMRDDLPRTPPRSRERLKGGSKGWRAGGADPPRDRRGRGREGL